jgi:hypothetical protein
MLVFRGLWAESQKGIEKSGVKGYFGRFAFQTGIKRDEHRPKILTQGR